MSLIGKILGNRYEIEEIMGVGGMATVYKAKDKILNRYVAVKILKDEFANDTDFIKRFQVEAQAAASLSHPNIVSVYDVGNEDNLHYIVMELIDGKTLKEVIKEKGKLPWKEAVNIASQIASGLSKAHANHIVHRDIKPHNIIITREGVAKVTDFGIAKAVSNSTINAFGSTVGSVHYFSPEHARGGYTDVRSDIYSLGVVLYEMVTGKLPFDADTPVSVALKHLQEEAVEPVELNSEIPLGLNNIIMKAMAKDISARYQTANEMYNDLVNIVRNPGDIANAVVTIRKEGEFPTQKIPIVGVESKRSVPDRKSDNDEANDLKKGLTKKQAIIRLALTFVLAIALFVVAFMLGNFVLNSLFGTTKTVKVPMIEGMEQEEAKRVLAELNLVMEVTGSVESEKYPAGYIESQAYKEGYELKEGATLGVTLSKGNKTVLVPDVTKSSVDVAKIEIEQRGLEFKAEYSFSKDIPSGDIISQNPTVNTEVAEGAVITVTISKGSQSGLINVPNVIGETEASASKKLTDAKLIPEVTTISDSDKQSGIVISQTPDANELLSELSTVVIVVNKVKEESATSTTDNTSSNSNSIAKQGKRQIELDLASRAKREEFNVKVTLESSATGTLVEYEGKHKRSEGKININISDLPGAYLKVYFDDEVVSEQVL